MEGSRFSQVLGGHFSETRIYRRKNMYDVVTLSTFAMSSSDQIELREE